MMHIPSQQQQIIQTHATLIVAVAQAAASGEIPPDLEQGLKVSVQNGWIDLVSRIRKIVAGNRASSLPRGLDEEDRIIIEAILRGIQDPTTLPDPNARADASMAAPGIAAMIHGARAGQAEALQMLATMAEQMTAASGDMARLGGVMKRLVDGERDVDALASGMGAQGQSLLNSIIEELGKLEAQ